MGSKPCGGDLQIEIFRETRIVAQALLAISDFRHAFSRTAGAWLQSPNPLGPAERFLGAIGLDIKKYRVSS